MKTNKKIKKEVVLEGVGTSPGIAYGPAYVFNPYSINVSELETEIDDAEQEILYFEKARREVLKQLKYAQNNSEANYGDQFSDIFETQQAFLDDDVLLNEIRQALRDKKKSAVHVVTEVLSKKSEYFINLENTYFRERAFDILDLKQKLILTLVGINIDYQLSKPSIVLAESLSPSDTVHFNRNFLLGFLTDKGGKTSHAAILARGLQLPAVVNGNNLSKIIQNDDFIILDGFHGKIIINPSDQTIKKYKAKQKEYQSFKKTLLYEIEEKTETLDGHYIQLMANIEFAHELTDVRKNHAEGIGLFRTEHIFMDDNIDHDEDSQFQIYKKLALQSAPHEVVIRTIDIGGDKIVEGFGPGREPNPYLGWRAIRFCLDRPDIFRTQLRAIYRASIYGKVGILIPLVSSISEISQTINLINEVKEDLQLKNIEFNDNVPLGIMVETPAAAISADIFAKYVDYFSIGTNDLTQYILAIDRTNDRVSKYFNSFNPAVLSMVKLTIDAARKNNISVTICGEFGAVPEAIPLLLGMGLKSFSLTPHFIPETKKIIRSISLEKCEKLYKKVRKLHTEKAVETTCRKFMQENITDIKLLN
jgi:phosphotransferase system enzyme I (PtsI)